MTKACTAPADPTQQLAEANATIEVLRRSVHEEHAGAAQAYLKLAEERDRGRKLETLLREAAAIMANPLATQKARAFQARIDDALKAPDGAAQ